MDVRWDALPTPIKQTSSYFTEPAAFLRSYNRDFLRQDATAALTVAVVLLPQSIAFALVAGLPPSMGLYAAVVGAIVGALWGSSNQSHTGPSSALSLLVLSSLVAYAQPDTPEFFVAAGLLAVMAGLLQIIMGIARLGMLVNFVSDAVIVGFAAGAGVLIGVGELRHFFGISDAPPDAVGRVINIITRLNEINPYALALGVLTLVVILGIRRYRPRLPGTLIALILTTLILFFLRLDQMGVTVLGELPGSLPPFSGLAFLDFELIGLISTSALAVTAIGLIQTMAVARTFAVQTRERLDSNQEFVGQGLANVAAGFFSGFPVSGSFSRSAVNYEAGAKTRMAALLSGLFVLIAMIVLGPVGRYMPRATLAGVLLVVAYNMIDRQEMMRIFQSSRGEALIMAVTFFGTIFLPIQFAVLSGILISLAYYILKTSTPRVHEILPNEDFTHLLPGQDWPSCPQLGIMEVWGDLYFGAVTHVEEEIQAYKEAHPQQFLLMLRMRGVHHIDISGIHMLEGLIRTYRDEGGDLFMTHLRPAVLALMKQTGFYDRLGGDNILDEDDAINYIFSRVMDPTICIYECPVRTWWECQNLPRPQYRVRLIEPETLPLRELDEIAPRALWERLRQPLPPIVIDIREPREWRQGHIPQAELQPLSRLLGSSRETLKEIPSHHPVVLVDRSGRRSKRLAALLQAEGYTNLTILAGGMQAWENEELLEAVEQDYAE